MHEDDEEADMRTQEELMMQHRYMMVSAALHLPLKLYIAALLYLQTLTKT